MISNTDIERLASLARIAVTPAEKDSFASQIDAILGYVDQLKGATVSSQTSAPEIGDLYNVMREDTAPHASGAYTEALLSVAPNRQGDYIKVKQIFS